MGAVADRRGCSSPRLGTRARRRASPASRVPATRWRTAARHLRQRSPPQVRHRAKVAAMAGRQPSGRSPLPGSGRRGRAPPADVPMAPSGDQYQIAPAATRPTSTEGGRRCACRTTTAGRWCTASPRTALPHGVPRPAVGAVAQPDPGRPPTPSAGGNSSSRLTEPAKRRTRSHGLVRWATVVGGGGHRDLGVAGPPADGAERLPVGAGPGRALRPGRRRPVVTQAATNLSVKPAPYASGAHPYFCVGDAIEDLGLRLPARTRVLLDDRQLPTGVRAASRRPRLHERPTRIGDRRARPRLRRPRTATRTRPGHRPSAPSGDRGVALWVDEHHRWPQVFTPPADGPRPGLAVEPMTAPADAFNSGTDLVALAPARHRRRRAVGVMGHPRPAARRRQGRVAVGADRLGAVGPVAVDQRPQLAYARRGPPCRRSPGSHRRDRGAVGQVEPAQGRRRGRCTPSTWPTRAAGARSRYHHERRPARRRPGRGPGAADDGDPAARSR